MTDFNWHNPKLRKLAEQITIFFPAKLRAQYIETLEDADDQYALFRYHSSKRKQQSLRKSARNAVRYAISMGRLQRSDICSECGRRVKVEAHHLDYKKRFEITWLCRDCHVDKHRVS
jgi:hypothetical protein